MLIPVESKQILITLWLETLRRSTMYIKCNRLFLDFNYLDVVFTEIEGDIDIDQYLYYLSFVTVNRILDPIFPTRGYIEIEVNRAKESSEKSNLKIRYEEIKDDGKL